jgi:hypothetical protein
VSTVAADTAVMVLNGFAMHCTLIAAPLAVALV